MLCCDMLLPRDILVVLKLHLIDDPRQSYERLGADVGLGASTLHRSVGRLMEAGLLTPERRVKRADLLDLLVYGVRFVYYTRPKEPTRGMPTAHAAAPLKHLLATGSSNFAVSGEAIPVWPDPLGSAQGYAVEPLDPIAPSASRRDERLYELLALVDAMRIGHTRDRMLAIKELQQRLEPTKALARR